MVDSLGAIGAIADQIESGDIVLAVALFLVMSSLACVMLLALHRANRDGGVDRYRKFSWQIGALLSLEQAYEFIRGRMSPNTPDIALLHSYRLLDLEWKHGLFVEQRLERFFLQFQPIMNAIDLFYVLGHLVGTIGVLVWIYVRRREQYAFVRNLLMLTTAIALVAFYVYPTAPPRMLGNYGFVDPLQLHHFVGEGGAQPGSYTYNPYAAMPSLHVGYALVVAWGLFVAERKTWIRVAAIFYPVVMAATVIISGNHWILDVAGAVVTVAISGVCILTLSWLGTRLLPRPTVPGAASERPAT
jgi:membrane-associated phospholipid phosphatase